MIGGHVYTHVDLTNATVSHTHTYTGRPYIQCVYVCVYICVSVLVYTRSLPVPG